MIKINIVSLFFLLCLLLAGSAAFAQDLPVSEIAINTPVVQDYQTASPTGFSLSQNYQDPFTIIKFRVERQGNVKLMVTNEYGREVITIMNKYFNPGSYEIKLDASDLGEGVFFCKISTPFYSESKKLLLVK
jgi:hypothetical protein